MNNTIETQSTMNATKKKRNSESLTNARSIGYKTILSVIFLACSFAVFLPLLISCITLPKKRFRFQSEMFEAGHNQLTHGYPGGPPAGTQTSCCCTCWQVPLMVPVGVINWQDPPSLNPLQASIASSEGVPPC